MKRFLYSILKGLADLAIWFITLALLICLIRLPRSFEDANLAWAFLGGFLVGLPLFYRFRCIPCYVFGHELTHWAVATLFLRKTSNIRLSLNSGSVDVDRPNIWIILAPYFLPFYMLLILGIYGIVLLFDPPFPAWVDITIAAIIGLSYAYHVILTCIAISKGQQDLQINGVVFSLSLIIVCNVFFVYLGLMIGTRQLLPGFKLLVNQLAAQSEIVWQAIRSLIALCRAEATETP